MTDEASDWRDEIDDTVMGRLEDALRKGVTPEELARGIGDAARESAVPIAEDLVRDSSQARNDLDAVLEDARHVVGGRWGHALELFAGLIHGADELYGDYHRRRTQESDSDGDDTFWVLAGLMARAVRTANEVYALLQGGFPSGALARARTMHEIAVITAAIGPNRETGVAERYIDHAQVESYRRMTLYQTHAQDLGYEPFTDVEMTSAKRTHDAVLAKHRRGFGGQYGWSVPLFESNANPRLEDLEELLDMTRLRPWKKWADHEIHPTSHGSMLNLVNDHEGRHRVTGPVDTGLADPAQVALIALVQTLTVAVVHGAPGPSRPTDLTLLAAITQLLDRALDTFAEIERDTGGGESTGPDVGSDEDES